MGKNQHVTPHKEGGWQVKGENNTRATIRTDTQAEAIQRARISYYSIRTMAHQRFLRYR